MDFENRVKKELAEGVIRAVLVDAGYRVLDFGIESQIRELECLTKLEYFGLDFPKALKAMPDMVVMDREQSVKYLVEIKYRSGWSRELLDEVEEQVRLFKEVTLIYLNSAPELPVEKEEKKQENKALWPSSYLRCCRLRWREEVYEAEVRFNAAVKWIAVSDLGDHAGQWWGLRPMQDVFGHILKRKEEKTLIHAINAVRGIIRQF